MSLIHAKSEVTNRKEQFRSDLKTDAAENKHLDDGKEMGNKRLCGLFCVLNCFFYDSITVVPKPSECSVCAFSFDFQGRENTDISVLEMWNREKKKLKAGIFSHVSI